MDKIMNDIALVFAVAIGAIALGIAMTSLGITLDYDIDFFKFANNVTEMDSVIQDDIKSKEFTVTLFTSVGFIATIAGTIMLVIGFYLWKKLNAL